ncbi:MAG: hypothetical protein JWO06_4005 [Bacteroidota bacterium]|nr:hypothetical protein [Bacteroidota bacterium]
MALLEKRLNSIFIREVGPEETDLLPAIFKLRVTCRQDQGYITPENYPDGWFDEVDDSASHFAVFEGERLIGAARINYYGKISEHYYYHYFNDLSGYPQNETVAYLSRVVVHPDFRLAGISKSLVSLREDHAWQKGVKNILTDVCDFQIENFLKYGYSNLGMLHSEKIKWEVKPEDYFLMYKRLQ